MSLRLCRFGPSPAAHLQEAPCVSIAPNDRQGVFEEGPTTDPGQALSMRCTSMSSTRLHRLRERGAVPFPRHREDLPSPCTGVCWASTLSSDFQAQFQNLWLSLQSLGACGKLS